MNTTVSLAIRVFVAGVLESEEKVHASEKALHDLLPRLAEKHRLICQGRPYMIEIEFLDEPELEHRFFRIGTDPTLMVMPVRIEVA